VIVDAAKYVDGKREGGRLSIAGIGEAASGPDAFVWIGLHDPTPEELSAVDQEFGIHALVIEDALSAHQRPKMEDYGDLHLVVLKTAEYQEPDRLHFAELQLIVSERFVMTVRHGPVSPLTEVRKRLEQNPELLSHGPAAVLYAVVDQVVDDYAPVLDQLDKDVGEVEDEVFSDERTNPARRIYQLKRQLLDFTRFMQPLEDVLDPLARSNPKWCPTQLSPYYRDVGDHLRRVHTRTQMLVQLLSDALNANLAQAGVRQNDDMRTISAWAAIFAAPTALAGVWGMNFVHMPELDEWWGYPTAVVVMVAVCFGLYYQFKRSGWL
jgi:magnesium transporter